MKHEYHEGVKAGEDFEKLARIVFQKPRLVVPKKQPKVKPKRSKTAASDSVGATADWATVAFGLESHVFRRVGQMGTSVLLGHPVQAGQCGALPARAKKSKDIGSEIV
jgi:hypothetical protein